jgi:hypothetical protein
MLSRNDIEAIIFSQNCFKVASTIATKIFKHIKPEYFDTHYFLIISKLFSDSLDALHEDSRELLQLKYKDKYESFQSKSAIELYLQEVKILCQADYIDSSTLDSSPDIFTTDDEVDIKPIKTVKELSKSICKVGKKSSSNSTKSDEEKLVKTIKEKRQIEEYDQVCFNDDDNKKIDAIFFD